MASYITRRLIGMVPLVLGVTFITFALMNLVPGSPASQMTRNPRLRPADRVRIEQHMGLDRPWPVRYAEWLGHVVRGDLGLSMTNATPVTDRILGVLPNTLLLTTSALVVSLLVAVPLGIVTAVKHDRWVDHTVGVGVLVVIAMPAFWFPLLLVILVGVKMRQWGLPSLPVSGMRDLRGEGGAMDRLRHLILPVLSLAIVQAGGLTLYVRTAMLEALEQDYVRTALSKGLRLRRVVYGHALRNALSPLVTLVALSIPGLFAGALFVEEIFAWNGLGLLTIQAFTSKDATLVMAITLILSVLTMLANLLADIFAAILDPRVSERETDGH